jgi:penicillin-binding protein 2
VRRELAVSPENLAIVRQALVGVVNEPKGTAFKVRSKDIEVAGKTGTAQVRGRGGETGTYEAATHAWFVGFAPASRPRIAVSVLVEHGGHGGDVAAPLAVEIVDNYFETVAPEQKAAPKLGLPRRHGGAAIPVEPPAPKANDVRVRAVKKALEEAPPMKLDFSKPEELDPPPAEEAR